MRKESTAHFMAPEIMRVNRELEGAFYGLAADAWSFGICLYNFYMYYMPFADDENIVRDIYNIVLYQHEGLPAYVEFDDDGLVVIIQALLSGVQKTAPPLLTCSMIASFTGPLKMKKGFSSWFQIQRPLTYCQNSGFIDIFFWRLSRS